MLGVARKSVGVCACLFSGTWGREGGVGCGAPEAEGVPFPSPKPQPHRAPPARPAPRLQASWFDGMHDAENAVRDTSVSAEDDVVVEVVPVTPPTRASFR